MNEKGEEENKEKNKVATDVRGLLYLYEESEKRMYI